MLANKQNNNWVSFSTQKVDELVNQLAASLLRYNISYGDLTVEGRDKIAILCPNRAEWMIIDLAVQKIGAILVPIYPTISVLELEYVLKDSEAKIVFVADKNLYDKLSAIKNNLPSVKEIVCIDEVATTTNLSSLYKPITETEKNAIEQIANKIKPNDVATLIYTSGTTGTPKGVMLTHDNILSNVIYSRPAFPPGSNFRALSFLPLNHIFERMVTYLYFYQKTEIYYAESLETIGDNLKEIKPHIFTTVPRLLEKVYEKIMKKGTELTGIKKSLFNWAVKLAEQYEINTNLGFVYNTKLAIANKLIFSKWREALGGNVLCIVTGAAACQLRLLKVFTAAKIIIMEGYGLTETSPVISVNRFDENDRKFGTIGTLLKNVEVKLAEDGEICCKGSSIMLGYYKRDDLTKEVIKDGWFHTGDIGTWVDNKFLKITDRKKEIFKTSGGKYVAPQPIENKMKESAFIEQIMVVGSEKKFAGALIVPSIPNVKEWMKERNLAQNLSVQEIIALPEVKKLFDDIVDGFNGFFNHVEQVKKFELIPNEWTVDGGELTPTQKLKRKVILEKYENYFNEIYN